MEEKQGESGLIVRDHVSISRSDWTLGAVGKSLSLQIIKVLRFTPKKHKIRIHLITSASQDEETDPARSAFPQMP